MNASDLLYGERKRGNGLKPVIDVTDLFFRLCLDTSYRKRLLAAFQIIADEDQANYQDILKKAEAEGKKAEHDARVRAIAYDVSLYEEIRPIKPRRKRDAGRWVVELMANAERPYAFARINSVSMKEGELIGKATILEHGMSETCHLNELGDFEIDGEGDCFLDLVNFIDEVCGKTAAAFAEGKRK